MADQFQTEQEAFWAGEFGREYMDRNKGDHLLAANLALFARVLSQTRGIGSVIEFGANIGLNLQAITRLLPRAELAAVEINELAASQLRTNVKATVYCKSILEFEPEREYDLAVSKGVLIHIAPERLDDVYKRLWQASRRYILIVEYYNPTPMEIAYRGHRKRLFKRDFAGDLLQRYSNLHLRDYGFVYHRDSVFPGDDLTWFLLEKEC